MFGTFFKSSIKALPVLVIVPLGIFTLYTTLIHALVAEYLDVNRVWLDNGRFYIMRNMVIAVIINFVFLMIIPALFGGLRPAVKRVQFYTGFFINLALSMIFPIVLCFWYVWVGSTISDDYQLIRVDNLTFVIIVVMHAIMFLGSFVLGALLVAPAYAKSFWFGDRN